MTAQESRLSIVVDTRNSMQAIQQLRTSLRELEQDGVRIRELFNNMRLNLSGANAFNNTINNINRSVSNVTNNFNRMGDVINNNLTIINQTARQTEGIFGRLQGLLAGGMFVGYAISVAKTADEMQSLNSQIKLVTQSEQQAIVVKEKLRAIADKNYASDKATIGLYQNSARALAQMGKSQNDALNFTNAVSLAMQTGGKSAQEQSAAILQLGQAMQSGVLQGDEFRSLAENAPILLDLVAKQLHVTRGEVKKLASDGKVTSEVVFNAITGATKQLEGMAAKMPVTMGQAFELVKNKYVRFIDETMNGTGGISSKIAGAIVGMAQHFDDLSKIAIAGVAIGMLKLANTALIAGGAFTKLATIIRANPLFFLAGVIIAASVATRGLDGTLNDLGDTIGVVGSIVGDLAGFFTDVGSVAYQVFKDISGNADKSADNATGAFDGFFDDTGTGFQGFLVGTAKVFDAIAALVRAAAITGAQYMAKFVNDVSNFFTTLSNNVKTVFAGVINQVVESVNQVIGNINSVINRVNSISVFGRSANIGTIDALQNYIPKLGQTTPSEKVSFADNMEQQSLLQRTNGLQAYIQAKYDAVKAEKKHTAAIVDLSGPMDKRLAAEYAASQAAKAKEEADKAAAKAAKERAKAEKDLGNTLVSNAELKGLPIKGGIGGQATSNGLITQATAEFAKITNAIVGDNIKYFSGFNDHYHRNLGGKHPKGMAFDIVLKDPSTRFVVMKDLREEAQKRGYQIAFSNEYDSKNKNTTAPHLHVSVLGRKNVGANGFDFKAYESQLKASEKAQKEQDRLAKQATKADEEETQKRLEILKKFGINKAAQIQAQLDEDLAQIAKSNKLTDAERTQAEEVAKRKAQAELDAYRNGLTDRLDALSEFKKTEQELLGAAHDKSLRELLADSEMHLPENSAVLQRAKELIDEKYQFESDALKRRNQLQILDAQQGYEYETKLMLQKYAVERENIIKNHQLSQKLKDELLLKNERDRFAAMDAARGKIGQRGIDAAAAVFQRQNPNGYAAWDLQNQYSSAMGGLNQDYQNQVAGINTITDVEERNRQLLEAERAFQESKFATEQEYAQKAIDLENARKQQQLDSYQSIFGSMSSIAADAFGKQSAAYRAMFAIEKGFAVAKAVMNMQVAMTEAAKLPFPLNLSQYATVATQMASIVGTIKGVSAPTGMAHSGLDYIPREGTWLLDKGERVLSPRQNRDLTDYLSNRSQQSNITINNNHGGAEVQATQHPDGSVTIDVVQKMIKQSWRNTSNPNSHEAKQLQRNFDTRVKR